MSCLWSIILSEESNSMCCYKNTTAVTLKPVIDQKRFVNNRTKADDQLCLKRSIVFSDFIFIYV